jgi:hypothetical protein
MKISKKRLKEIIEDEMREGRVITPGVANDLTTQMNNLAGALQKFDPSVIQGQPASDLRAAWIALESSMGDVFGDGLENAAVPTRKPLEEGCGMEAPGALTDEPMPMPGPPPEPNRALEPVYDDDEGQMAMGQLSSLVNDAGELTNLLGGQTQLPSWVQAKVTKATDYISAVKNYLQYQQQAPQGLHEMKITKQRLIKIIKEELQLEAGGDPVGPVEVKKVAELLQSLGFTLTRGGENSFIEFMQGLESQGDLNATPDSRRGALAEEAGFVGHHAEIDGKTYVDSNFLNSVKKIRDSFPHELKSMGFGEFYLETPKGKVQFDRSRGQSVQGTIQSFVGRAHELYGEPPELADELMAAMEAAGASEAVSIVGVGGSDSEGYSKVAGTRPMEEGDKKDKEMEEEGDDLKKKWTDVKKKKEETNESKIKISRDRLMEIIKEELTEVGSGFRMHRRPAKITRSPAVPVAQVQKQAKQFKDRQSETLFDKGYQDGLKGEEMQYSGIKAYEAGYQEGENEKKVEEAGRPHSMRGGRTMADLDKDAKTRETDFLKKKDDEKDAEKKKDLK